MSRSSPTSNSRRWHREKFRRQQALHQGGDRHDDDSALQSSQAVVQGEQPLRNQLRSGEKDVVGGSPNQEAQHVQRRVIEARKQILSVRRAAACTSAVTTSNGASAD